MSIRLMGFGVVGVGVLGAVGLSELDKSTNYTEVPAKIISADVDCYVSKFKSKLIDKKTGEKAYMPCEIAPQVAEKFGYKAKHVKKRVRFKYSYVSPVDGKTYRKSGSRESSVSDYQKGKTITIHAHKEVSDKTRL